MAEGIMGNNKDGYKMLLDKITEIRVMMIQKKPKQEVLKKYIEYLEEYDKADKTIWDKIEHQDFYYQYQRYMERK